MYSKKIIIGLTLIELMITLMLSMIILSTVYSVLLYSLKTLNLQTGIAHLQENSRVMAELFTQSFRNKSRDNEINYFIAKTGRLNKDGSPVFALFKKEKEQQKEELIENVYYLQINYDVLEEDNVFEVKPSRVTDWEHVVGISIEYELRDSDSIPAQRKKGFVYVAL